MILGDLSHNMGRVVSVRDFTRASYLGRVVFGPSNSSIIHLYLCHYLSDW